MVQDSRYRTKVFLDTYWIPTNAKKDDGTTNLGVETMFAYPEYPLELEFKAPSVVDIIITIDQPNSHPLVDGSQAPYAYEEDIPIEIIAVDKTGITATKAMWQAEAEMRRILESYPTGSLRRIQEARPSTSRLGSTTLWSAKYVWTYTRGLT